MICRKFLIDQMLQAIKIQEILLMLIKELKLKYNATQPISISEDNTNTRMFCLLIFSPKALYVTQ